MAKIGTKGSYCAFYCPGCKCVHQIPVMPDAPHGWEWNGDIERPTFFPSVNVNQGFCHSWVKDGTIQFLPDTHGHGLAGQTVELPDWTLGDDY